MRFSRPFRHLIWLVVIALLVQPLLGQRVLEAAAQTSTMLVICTGTGFKTIQVPNGYGPPMDPVDPSGQQHGSTLDCLVCLIQGLGQLDDASNHGAPTLLRYWIVETSLTDRWSAEPLCHRPLHSRAPPLA
ncbi:MAG: DUF2946 family protein [Geminicoccales bacterium]